MKALTTGCRVRQKGKQLEVDSDKYNDDLSYQNHINNTLNSLFVAIGDSYNN